MTVVPMSQVLCPCCQKSPVYTTRSVGEYFKDGLVWEREVMSCICGQILSVIDYPRRVQTGVWA